MVSVSVIMPVYNTEVEYLQASIDSILAQTFTDFELIIIDNGSNAYVGGFLSSYTDERIKRFRLERNRGPAVARNFGIWHAEGEFIAFQDSDDISLPRRLETQVAFLKQNPEIGCLGTSAKIVDNATASLLTKEGSGGGPDQTSGNPQSRTIAATHKERSFPPPKTHLEIECFLLLVGCVFCLSSVMLRKRVLDANQLKFNPEYVPAEDYLLWLDLIGKTRFAVLEDELVLYRYHEESVSHSQRQLQRRKGVEAQFHAFEKHCHLSLRSRRLWLKFINGQRLSREENEELMEEITRAMDALVAKGHPRDEVFNLFKKTLRKIYYHTRTLKGQWTLISSPVNKLFHVGLAWRLFCLITRGLF